MTENIPEIEVFAVNADDPAAMSAVRKLCEHGGQHNQVIPMTAEEFEAMRTSFVKVKITKRAQD